MKKSVFTLLVLLACTLSPLHAYEYFTIYFTDGTKSGAFYATDVDSICYSKIDIDGVEHADWQVQEIYTCDSVYRYSLGSIDNVSFTDVDENQITKDITTISQAILPWFNNSPSLDAFSQYIPSILNIEGVESACVEKQSLAVKIKNWGTMHFLYPVGKGIEANLSRKNMHRNPQYPLLSATGSSKHDYKKMCIVNQMINDEKLKDETEDKNRLAQYYREWGVDVDIVDDPMPQFFANGIFDYDLVFIDTHGFYSLMDLKHWLLTAEELFRIDKDEEFVLDENKIQELFNAKYPSPENLTLCWSKVDEINNGKQQLVCYTAISENLISSSKKTFKPGTIVFNAACESLTENYNLATAFTKRGAACYLGYTDTNTIGGLAGYVFFGSMLNGKSVGAYELMNIGLRQQNTTLEDGTHIEPQLLCIPKEGVDVHDLRLSLPETLPAELISLESKDCVKLCGKVRVYDAINELGFDEVSNSYGIIISEDSQMQDAETLEVKVDYDEATDTVTIEAILDREILKDNTTYYYQAYMHDGNSYCYGEVKSYSTAEPYCVLKDGTLTFYYDGKRNEREGVTFVINNNNVFPTWSNYRDLIQRVFFDSSFKDYSPQSTAYWFNGLELESVNGLRNLNTSKVTTMEGMFLWCNIQNINWKDLNTDNVSDMRFMFSQSYFEHLDLTGFNTSNVTNMRNMFYECYYLKSLDLSSFNTSNVTDMCGMFYRCSSLTSLDLSSFNTSNVKYMGGYSEGNTWFMGMFAECESLTNLDLSSFNTSNVTSMSNMFSGCKSLTNLDLSSFNTSNVTSMGGMFGFCESLTSLDLSSFNTSNVTNMSFMFGFCKSLTNLDLSSFNTSNVTNMEGMLKSCTSLEYLDFRNITINGDQGKGLFSELYNLKTLNLSNADTSEATTMENMFEGCSSISNLDLSSFNTNNVTSMYCMFNRCKSLINLDLSCFDTSNVTSMGGMFHACFSLVYLDLSSFNTSNVTSMSGMFYECKSLTNLDLSSFDTSNVTSMGNMFGHCASLTNLDLSSFNTSNVTSMGGMFGHCESLTSLDLSSFNTSNVTSMNEMFYACFSLVYLDLSSFNTSNVTDMSSGMFTHYYHSLEYLDFRNITIKGDQGKGLFSELYNLKTLNLSNADTSEATTMENMFANCKSLTNLDLSSFNTSNVTDMRDMFSSCSALTTIYGTNWNTSNVTKSSDMFYGCPNLVGGMGTKVGRHRYYDENGWAWGEYDCPADARAAHIDGGKDNPGLFTAK